MQFSQGISLNRVSTVDALADSLRQQILDGSLRAGTPLREVEVAERYGVGRNSVRAAFQRLIHEGVLRHEAFRGVQVPAYGEQDIRDVYLLRTAIEVEAARTIVSAGLDTSEAATALAALEEADADPNVHWGERAALDLAFHQALVRALGSDRMQGAFDALVLEVRLLQAQIGADYPAPRSALVAQHRVLLEAVQGDDPAVAEGRVRDHLSLSELEVRRAAQQVTG